MDEQMVAMKFQDGTVAEMPTETLHAEVNHGLGKLLFHMQTVHGLPHEIALDIIEEKCPQYEQKAALYLAFRKDNPRYFND